MTLAAPRGRRASRGGIWGFAGLVILIVAAGVAAMGVLPPILVLAGLLAIAGAAAIVLDPQWGLIAVAAFAVLRLADVATNFHGAPPTFAPLVAIVLLGLILRGRATAEWPVGGGRALLLVAAYGAIAIGSLLISGDSGDGTGAVRTLFEDGAVAVLAGMLLRGATDLHRLVWALVGGGALLATLSIFQFATGSFGSTFGGFAQSAVQNIFEGTDDVRISGPVGDPNFYAQLLVMIIPLAFDRMRDEISGLLRSIAGYAVVAMAVTVVLTFSRGGLLALAIVMAFMVVRHPPRLRTVAAAGLLLVAALPLMPSGYAERLTSLTEVGEVEAGIDPSLRGRTAELGAAMAMFWDRPLTGVGFGNFAAEYPAYSDDLGIDVRDTPREAHNLYLETAAETGLVGLVALTGLVVASFTALAAGRRRFRRMADLRSDGIGFAVAVSLVGYLVTSVFLHMAFARLAWLVIGIALAFPSVARAEDESRDAAVQEAAWR
ncbi:MAG: O-antigen ligase family protein [Acidimicrobiia bacterium]